MSRHLLSFYKLCHAICYLSTNYVTPFAIFLLTMSRHLLSFYKLCHAICYLSTKLKLVLASTEFKKKNSLYLSVKVFSTRVLLVDTIFTSPTETGRPLYLVIRTACSEKGVPLFLSYFKTLSIGLAPGIKPATFRSAVKRSTN